MPGLRMPCGLGTAHQQQAYNMTCSAALAVAVCLTLLAAAGVVASPLLALLAPVYFVAELLFAMIWYYRYLMLSYQPVKHRPLSHDPVSSFKKAMAHLKLFADIRHFLSIWFHGAPLEDIKRDNVADLLAYAFFYKTRDEVDAEGRAHELEAMVQFIEATWDVTLTPGHNPSLRWMCHLWEPMKVWYEPLGFYLFMEAAALLGALALRAAGFKQSRWSGLTYYTRNMPHSSSHGSGSRRTSMQQQPLEHGSSPLPHARHQWCDQAASSAARQRQEAPGSGGNEVPLVLLHGIGMGLIPYISLLFNMAATGRPLLALEFKHVSMRWVLWVPTVDEVAEVLVAIMQREGLERCCLVGHSYGTAVASRLLQQHPAKVVQTCMIDPVCFSMFMPNLLRNFLYESPGSGSRLGDFMMQCAARDVHVSATLSRRFFWSDVNLFEEQLPGRSLVVLSGQDVLMAAAKVRRGPGLGFRGRGKGPWGRLGAACTAVNINAGRSLVVLSGQDMHVVAAEVRRVRAQRAASG
ncbi:hypothetical protein OEZ85_011858 [Tetradesmus obliquus]|uniref:AB hydrolase-1 domain-containing protein n=1 Tax=Tetradesmus obliquus TaxID=3088 RepID=A0ABY8TSC7_TETOB|nr:hypothetical protein OEZ85_011858 [Tetradesmus obliquus]